jgi:hypothetical protein
MTLAPFSTCGPTAPPSSPVAGGAPVGPVAALTSSISGHRHSFRQPPPLIRGAAAAGDNPLKPLMCDPQLLHHASRPTPDSTTAVGLLSFFGRLLRLRLVLAEEEGTNKVGRASTSRESAGGVYINVKLVF